MPTSPLGKRLVTRCHLNIFKLNRYFSYKKGVFMKINPPKNNPMMGGLESSNPENSSVKSVSSDNPMMGPYRILNFSRTQDNPLIDIKKDRRFSYSLTDSGYSFVSQDSSDSTANSKKSRSNNIKNSSSIFINPIQNHKNKIQQLN
jgi:hypothetical protein